MLNNLNIFWRYYLTGLLGILLSAVLTFIAINHLDVADNKSTFKNETYELFLDIERQGLPKTNQNIGALTEDAPFSVSRSKKSEVDLAGDVIDLGNNRFRITYFSEKLNHGITFEDKENHPDEDETDDYGEWLDLLTRLFWIAAIVVFLGFGFYLISRRIDQHIQRLVKVSEQISASNFEVKVPIDSPPPIKNLAIQLDSTRENIKQLIDKEKTLAYAIPHELRTPLSKLRLALDLSRKNETVKDYQDLVESLDIYTDELEQIIDSLMQLAKTERQLVRTPIALDNKLLALKDDFSLLYPSKHITVKTDITEVHSCEPQIDIILKNLFENACKYSDQEIVITVSQTNQHISIIFSNDGQAIPTNLHDKIFTPFFRTEQSRDRKQGGVGLGLALVKQAVEQLKGTVRLIAFENYAASVSVNLPNHDCKQAISSSAE